MAGEIGSWSPEITEQARQLNDLKLADKELGVKRIGVIRNLDGTDALAIHVIAGMPDEYKAVLATLAPTTPIRFLEDDVELEW